MKIFCSFFDIFCLILCFVQYAEGGEFPPLALACRDDQYELEVFQNIKKSVHEHRADLSKSVVESVLCCFTETPDRTTTSETNIINKIITEASDLADGFSCQKKYVPTVQVGSEDVEDWTTEFDSNLVTYRSGYEVCDSHDLLSEAGLSTLNGNCQFFPTLNILYDGEHVHVKQVRYELIADQQYVENDEPCADLDLGSTFFNRIMEIAYSKKDKGDFKPQLLAPKQHFRDDSLQLPACTYLNAAPVYANDVVDVAWKQVRSFVRRVGIVSATKLEIITGTHFVTGWGGTNLFGDKVPIPHGFYTMVSYRKPSSESSNIEYIRFGMILYIANVANQLSSDLSFNHVCEEVSCETYYNNFKTEYDSSEIRCCAFTDSNLRNFGVKIKEQGSVKYVNFQLSSFQSESSVHLVNLAEKMKNQEAREKLNV